MTSAHVDTLAKFQVEGGLFKQIYFSASLCTQIEHESIKTAHTTQIPTYINRQRLRFVCPHTFHLFRANSLLHCDTNQIGF